MTKPIVARLFIGFLSTVAVVGLSAVPGYAQKPSRPPEQLWSGKSGGFRIISSARDITASPLGEPGKVIFSARKIAGSQLAKFEQENVVGEPSSWHCSYTVGFKLLSLVGSLLSYQESADSYCGQVDGPGWNHPANEISYHTIDLNQPSRLINLTDFFSESELLRALLSDPAVEKALTNAQGQSAPRTLAELLTPRDNGQLEIEPVVSTAESPKGCAFFFPERALSQFAFHHLEQTKVAVRLSLDPSSGACHSAHAQLGVLLPVPRLLEAPLTSAQSRTEGFLMNDTKQLFGGKATVFAFEPKGRPAKRKQ